MLSKRGILLFANHYDCPALREKFRRSRDRLIDIRVDPGDLGAISVRIRNEWHPAPVAGGDLDGVSLAAWRESFTRLRQHHRERAELARGIREDAIAAIHADVAKKVALLLPGTLNVTARQIEELDKKHFHGTSFASDREVPALPDVDVPFGTRIAPMAAPSERHAAKTKRPSEPKMPHRAGPTQWRMEDE